MKVVRSLFRSLLLTPTPIRSRLRPPPTPSPSSWPPVHIAMHHSAMMSQRNGCLTARPPPPSYLGCPMVLGCNVMRLPSCVWCACVTEHGTERKRSEFFVQEKKLESHQEQASLWHEKYRLIPRLLPKFIDKELAAKILTIGKAINFLRRLCGDSEWIMGPMAKVRRRDLLLSVSDCGVSIGRRFWLVLTRFAPRGFRAVGTRAACICALCARVMF